MSPVAQVCAGLLCSLLIAQSAFGTPIVVERHRRQSFDPNASIQTGENTKTNVPREASDVTGGGTTLRPLEERRSKSMNFECLHGFLKGEMSCECDEGWTGTICSHTCTLKCLHGTCNIKPHAMISNKPVTEEDMFCNCDRNYYNERCTEKISDPVGTAERNARKLVIGTCLGVVGLAAVIIFIIIVMRRTRQISAIRALNVLKVKGVSDGKMYDAYISSGATDRALKFVNNVLVPQLEQQGFKLLIPSPDELSAPFISDDIITAIKQSRRIIMVVTPEYLQNDWTGFEVLNAQAEMKTLQKRIIPVILEDVPFSEEAPKIKKCLKHILDPEKCLKVPGYDSASPDLRRKPGSKEKMDKFWWRLELAISKTGELNTTNKSNNYNQIGLSEQQNTLDDRYSKSISDLQNDTKADQTYDTVE